jgi:hypothetical protein
MMWVGGWPAVGEVQECNRIFVREKEKSCPGAGFLKKHLAPMQDAMKKPTCSGASCHAFSRFSVPPTSISTQLCTKEIGIN